MLEEMLKTAYKHETTKLAQAEYNALLRRLPNAELYALATGQQKLAMESGETWVQKFEGTPLLESAVSLEKEELQLDMQESQQNVVLDEQQKQRDSLAVKKRLLELDLVSGGSGTEEAGNAPPNATLDAPTEQPMAAEQKQAAALFRKSAATMCAPKKEKSSNAMIGAGQASPQSAAETSGAAPTPPMAQPKSPQTKIAKKEISKEEVDDALSTSRAATNLVVAPSGALLGGALGLREGVRRGRPILGAAAGTLLGGAGGALFGEGIHRLSERGQKFVVDHSDLKNSATRNALSQKLSPYAKPVQMIGGGLMGGLSGVEVAINGGVKKPEHIALGGLLGAGMGSGLGYLQHKSSEGMNLHQRYLVQERLKKQEQRTSKKQASADGVGRLLANVDIEKNALAALPSKGTASLASMAQRAFKANPGAVIGAGAGLAGGLAHGLRKDENGERHLLGGVASGVGGAVLGAGAGHAAGRFAGNYRMARGLAPEAGHAAAATEAAKTTAHGLGMDAKDIYRKVAK
jgi:hypothetical protein